jgi:hypothetical protein
MMSKIKEKTKHTAFLSIIEDEVVDVSEKSQLLSSVYYVTHNGGVQE